MLGEVAVIVPCGGSGTRFDNEIPKPLMENPHTGKTLLQEHVDSVAKVLGPKLEGFYFGVGDPVEEFFNPSTLDGERPFKEYPSYFSRVLPNPHSYMTILRVYDNMKLLSERVTHVLIIDPTNTHSDLEYMYELFINDTVDRSRVRVLGTKRSMVGDPEYVVKTQRSRSVRNEYGVHVPFKVEVDCTDPGVVLHAVQLFPIDAFKRLIHWIRFGPHLQGYTYWDDYSLLSCNPELSRVISIPGVGEFDTMDEYSRIRSEVLDEDN